MGRECATPNLASNRGFGRDFVTIDDPNRVCPREDLNLREVWFEPCSDKGGRAPQATLGLGYGATYGESARSPRPAPRLLVVSPLNSDYPTSAVTQIHSLSRVSKGEAQRACVCAGDGAAT